MTCQWVVRHGVWWRAMSLGNAPAMLIEEYPLIAMVRRVNRQFFSLILSMSGMPIDHFPLIIAMDTRDKHSNRAINSRQLDLNYWYAIRTITYDNRHKYGDRKCGANEDFVHFSAIYFFLMSNCWVRVSIWFSWLSTGY